MSIVAPIILLPTAGADYTTDISIQTLSGTTVADTQRILVNGSLVGVTYTAGELAWSWTGTLSMGTNTIRVTAVQQSTGDVSLPTEIVITLVQADAFVTVTPPTGVQLKRYQDKVEVICVQNPETDVVGYNYYVSTQSGGLNNVYAKINTDYVTEPTFTDDVTLELSREVDQAGNIKVTTITEETTTFNYYSADFDETVFNRLVEAGELPDVSFTQDTRFFYVMTAVIYDTSSGQVTESTYSAELEGSPITIVTGIQDLPARVQNDIILTYSRELLAGDDNVDTKPGTVMRDIIDPISEEQARVYVVQDFLSRSLSVSGLLEFDDADGDGVSDPVSESMPKRALQIALHITNPADLQRIIDDQFDKMAANVNMIRQGATPATGTVVFYTETAPIRDMYVNAGSLVSTTGDLDTGLAAQSYTVLETKILEFANREYYYNSQEQRYELEATVQSVFPGSSANTDSNTVVSVGSGIDSDFLVENPNPISFGEDEESNHDLASRVQLGFFADTGTEGGYAKTALSVPRVRNVRVEKAGDELMQRDWDDVRMEHVGGKVDIYIQGSKPKTVTDQIAFSFESIQSTEGTQTGEQFTIISASSFQFKTQNSQVTAHTPIFEVSRVRNATRGADYDLTGYQIIGDGTIVDLNEARPSNASIGLSSTDIIRVDYKYRSSDTFTLSNQPVDEIVSVTGQLSGTLTSDNWELVKLQDPLEDGESTIAQDGVKIKFANNLPLTEFQTITNEAHVLIVDVPESLNYFGIDTNTIVVTNSAGTVTYTENIDYVVSAGTQTTATTIEMLETGSIQNGQQVAVGYTAIENFSVVYTTNDLLNDVQNEVDDVKHACADVIVKNAIENEVDFVITVVPKAGVTNTNLLESQIKTAVSNFITQLGIGRSLTQSEIDNVIKNVDDVDYVVIPFIRMVKADGSFIVRDDVGIVTFEEFNQGLVTSYITSASVLEFDTINQGGPTNLFRGIFENEMPLVLQTDPLDVSGAAGRGYIRNDGKIIVSTRDGALPDTKFYKVSYYVYGETGSKDINVNSVEHLKVGSFSINFDTPRNLSRQSL